MAQAPAGRRERYRAETRAEAKRLALGQLAESGLGAVSLNAIARQMGVTGPALYRYFAGRDELLAELVVDAYEDLADAVHAAAHAPGPHSPRSRVRAMAAAYRDWALSQPHRYRLLYCTVLPGSGPDSGVPGERTAPAARRAMTALLDQLGILAGVPPRAGGRPDALVRLGLAAWARWHGVLSLQLGGHLNQLRHPDHPDDPALAGPDPAGMFNAEVDAVLDAAERFGVAKPEQAKPEQAKPEQAKPGQVPSG